VIEIFHAGSGKKISCKVCLKKIRQGLPEKFQTGSGWFPGFFHDGNDFSEYGFRQIRLTFTHQGLLKNFHAGSA